MKTDREHLALFAAARDETITAEVLARLEDLLKTDPGARQSYLGFMQLHALLETRPPEVADDNSLEDALTESKIVRLPRPLALVWLGSAAAIAVAFVLGFQAFVGDGENASIATLLLAEDCEWNGISEGLAEGQRLEIGPVWLARGSAVLRFDGGAELILTGDTRIDLRSAGSAEIRHGEVVVRAESGAEGFLLATPSGEMVDLGTEFAVKVERTGATELHVHEGEVAAGDSVVSAGKAVRFEQSRKAATGKSVDLNAPRFDEMIRRANPRERRDLMQVYEGFHLDEGVYAPDEIVKGKGWSGPWRLRSREELGAHGPDSSNDMRVSHGRMNMAWPVRGGRLGMLEFPPGRNIRLREMAKPIDLSKDGITWFSFLAAESAEKNSGSRREDFRITFRSIEDYFGESLSFGWSKNRIPRVQTGGGPLRRALREIPADETVFCVAKIMRSAAGPDAIFFRFYRESDDLDIFEPADWDIEFRDADLAARLELLLITSDGGPTRHVDEIRIGPTWRSVTPLDKNFSAFDS